MSRGRMYGKERETRGLCKYSTKTIHKNFYEFTGYDRNDCNIDLKVVVVRVMTLIHNEWLHWYDTEIKERTCWNTKKRP